MQLLGWNVIPRAYGVRFDTTAAPWWLRVLFHAPFLDRFACHLLVRRGCAYLSPMDTVPEALREPVWDVGWRIEDEGYLAPGSRVGLEGAGPS